VIKRFIFLGVTTLMLVAADQGTKWWAASTLAVRLEERAPPACDPEGPWERRVRYHRDSTVHVVDGFFSMTYVENCAGAFGILRGQPESVRRPFFLAVSIAAVLFIVLLFRRLKPEQKVLTMALPFVLGGAIGNLIDRIHLRYVIDFIDWYYRDYQWPTFNVADAAIVVGVGLIIVDMFTAKRETEAASAKPKKDRAQDEPESDRDAESSEGDEEA